MSHADIFQLHCHSHLPKNKKSSGVYTGPICEAAPLEICLLGAICSYSVSFMFSRKHPLHGKLGFSEKHGEKRVCAIKSPVDQSVQSEHPASFVVAGLLQ